MAVPSAIIKPTVVPVGGVKGEGSKPSPSSPFSGLGAFDFSEIEKLTCKNLSPMSANDEPASKRNLSGNKWSKHSLQESEQSRKQQQDCNYGDEEGVVQTPEKGSGVPVSHSTPLTTTFNNGAPVQSADVPAPDRVESEGSPSPVNPSMMGVSTNELTSSQAQLPSKSDLSLPLLSGSDDTSASSFASSSVDVEVSSQFIVLSYM